MSVTLMAAVWKVQLPDSEKLVLLALADCANDEGACWPSMKTLTEKCSKSDRTIQAAIKDLVGKGHLTRIERPGKGCLYRVHPSTPEAASPPATPEAISPRSDFAPKGTTSTPEAASDKPSRTIIGEEAKASPPKRAPDRKDADAFVRPDWADAEVWRDFLSNRKRKRLPNTATAYRGFLADIDKLATDEWPPGRLLEHAAMKGWGAIYEPDEMKEQNNGRAIRAGGGHSAKPALVDIGRQVAAKFEARAAAAAGGGRG